MSEPITFTVYGNPIAQPRHKHTRYGPYIARRANGLPHRIHAWKDAIASACQKNAVIIPWTGPIQLDYAFYMKRPNDHYRISKGAVTDQLKPDKMMLLYHYIKPDDDNLCKALKDAITNSESIWRDDCQVCRGERRDKNWVGQGDLPRVEVWITAL